MKTIVYSFLLLVFYLPLRSHAQQTEKEQLLGTWSFNYEASEKKVENKTKSKFDSLPNQQRIAMESLYRDREIVFKANGDFTLTLSDGRKSTGIWNLNEKNKTIATTTPNGKVFTQKIKKLTATKLILKLEGIVDAKVFISELHYIKTQK